MSWRWAFHCCVCGRFCRPVDAEDSPQNVDGDYDTAFWCRRCFDKDILKATTNPERDDEWRWLSPYCRQVAKSIIRHGRKNSQTPVVAPHAAAGTSPNTNLLDMEGNK